MQMRDEQHHRSPRDVPPVSRPRGAAWRSLQADGVVWEGQVLLVGGEVDLAARMIVTHRRVAFVRGGEIVLEVPRGWLRQEPVLRRDGVLELFVATPESNPFDEPMRVPLRMREGHPAAGHIIAMLAPGGVRRIAPDAMSALERARDAVPIPTFGGFWDGVKPVAPAKRDQFPASQVADFDDLEAVPEASADLSNLVPFEPPDRLVRVPSNPPRTSHTNAYPIAGLLPRDQRRSPWTLIVRLAALTILLATAAALGAGRLNIRLPGNGFDAILAAPTPTLSGDAPAADAVDPAGASDPDLSSDELTAVAVGVGGAATKTAAEAQAAIASGETEPTQAPAAPLVVPTKPTIPTPAPASIAAPAPTSAPETAAAATAPNPADSTPPTLAQSATGEPTAREMVVGPMRVAISTAMRAETLPKYGLPPGSGEWVLIRAELVNEGDAAASLSMSDFRLQDRGTGAVANLDTGTDVIASLAGLKPARGVNDVIVLDPGDSAETLLLYLLPAGTGGDLNLVVGQFSLDLAPSLETGDATPTGDEAPTSVNASDASNVTRIAFTASDWRDRWGGAKP